MNASNPPDPAQTVIPVDPAGVAERCSPSDAPLTKVDLTIGGHTVIVEADRPMEDVAKQALELIQSTAGYARRMPVGFDTGHADTQIADW